MNVITNRRKNITNKKPEKPSTIDGFLLPKNIPIYRRDDFKICNKNTVKLSILKNKILLKPLDNIIWFCYIKGVREQITRTQK